MIELVGSERRRSWRRENARHESFNERVSFRVVQESRLKQRRRVARLTLFSSVRDKEKGVGSRRLFYKSGNIPLAPGVEARKTTSDFNDSRTRDAENQNVKHQSCELGA